MSGDEKADAYAAADLFVLVSDAENYGITIVEAIQHKCVVAASGEVGAAAWLADRGAVVIAPRTAPEAAAQLDRALIDSELRVQVLEAGRRVLVDELAPDTIDDSYARLVTEVFATGRRP